MEDLYIVKSELIFKDNIRVEKRLRDQLNKFEVASNNCGESWEISGLEDNISIIKNGILKGSNLKEIIAEYKTELLGKKVFDKYEHEFPLLIKYIDANDVLSVQVHPDDNMAKKYHKSFGKTEMWYVIEAEDDANLIAGLKTGVGREEFNKKLESNQLQDVLNYEKVDKGDVFYIPAGQIHAINKGILLAEIQQSADITYRVYDWDRRDKNGNSRELHVEKSLEAINFSQSVKSRINYSKDIFRNEIKNSDFFSVNLLNINKNIEIDYSSLDSFVIYMCVEGKCSIETPNKDIIYLSKGKTILIPATFDKIKIKSKEQAGIIEVYID